MLRLNSPRHVNARKRTLQRTRPVLQHPLQVRKDHRRTCASHLNQGRARYLSSAEREDSTPCRQRPFEVKSLQRKPNCSLDKRSTGKIRSNAATSVTKHVHMRSGGSDRQAANRTSCLKTLRSQRATGRRMQVASCGTRICTNSQSERMFLWWYSEPRHVTTFSHACCNLVPFGDCQFAFHQSPMPNDSKPLHAQLLPEARVQHSTFSLCKKAFQGVKISPQASEILSTEKIGVMGHEQLKSDPSKFVAKREKRKDDSILLRHMHDSSEKHPNSISCEILNA